MKTYYDLKNKMTIRLGTEPGEDEETEYVVCEVNGNMTRSNDVPTRLARYGRDALLLGYRQRGIVISKIGFFAGAVMFGVIGGLIATIFC